MISVDMIKAVAELTPLILGGCGFFTLIFYRKTISTVIENLSELKFKKGDAELSLVNSKETKSQSLTTENNLESGISDPVEPTDKEKQNERIAERKKRFLTSSRCILTY